MSTRRLLGLVACGSLLVAGQACRPDASSHAAETDKVAPPSQGCIVRASTGAEYSGQDAVLLLSEIGSAGRFHLVCESGDAEYSVYIWAPAAVFAQEEIVLPVQELTDPGVANVQISSIEHRSEPGGVQWATEGELRLAIDKGTLSATVTSPDPFGSKIEGGVTVGCEVADDDPNGPTTGGIPNSVPDLAFASAFCSPFKKLAR